MKRLRKKDAAYPIFSFGKGLKYYIAVLIFAVVFTQALRSPVSVVFMWFVTMMPVMSFIYVLIGRANVGAFVLSDETTVEKLTEIGYEFRVSNYSILPLPFTEVELFLPSEDGVMCESRIVSMSILPRGEYYFDSEVTFRYRGSYKVGVGCIYVSDMFRIIRMRRRVNIYSKIYVMPRRILYSRGDDNSPSDIPSESKFSAGGILSSEANQIREYRGGDPLQHIHWKLSSKMQDLQVNDYKPSVGKNIYIFCDFATLFSDENDKFGQKKSARTSKSDAKNSERHVVKLRLPELPQDALLTPEERMSAIADAASDRAAAAAAVAQNRLDATASQSSAGGESGADDVSERREDENFDAGTLMGGIAQENMFDLDEYCADGVSELAVGVVTDEIWRGSTVTLVWFDERAGSGFFAYCVRTLSDLDALFKHFGTAPFCDRDMSVTRLPALIGDDDSPTFIYVTAAASLDSLSDYIDASRGAGAERTEILLFDPIDRFRDKAARREYLERCRVRYGENNIILTTVDSSWRTKSGVENISEQ